MTPAAIRTMDLSKTFGVVRAPDHLTLEIPRWIIFGFLRPNGSGKTTTIRLLLGLIEPTSGTAEVLGFNIRTDAASVRQRSGAFPGVTSARADGRCLMVNLQGTADVPAVVGALVSAGFSSNPCVTARDPWMTYSVH